jgi:radical SAM superfamily enzyme YgiQ (UPF0313 family)
MAEEFNIVLINPPITTTERYGKMANVGSETPPLGLCYIASFLERKGYPVSIIDAEFLNLSIEETVKKALINNPKIIGITAAITTYLSAVQVGTQIKTISPSVPIIIGGPHISALKTEVMNDSFDYGIYGEGELTFLELVKFLNNEVKKPISEIDGIIYKIKGEYQINKSREFIKNLDCLPFPARHLLPDLKLYRPNAQNYQKLPATTIITSRGCPYNCIFCDHSVFGRSYRTHGAKYVVDEIQLLHEKSGINEFWFVDDTFTLDQKRASDICDEIMSRKLKISWSCLGRVNTVNPELLKKMKKAGCWMIAYGIETGNPEVLKFIKKSITIPQVTDAIRWTKEAQILTKGYFMLGHPVDSLETIDETIEFAKTLDLDYALFTITSPLPNTELFDICKKTGTLHCDEINKFFAWNAIYEPPGVTKEQLETRLRHAYKSFYLRPRYILTQLFHIRGYDDLKRHVNAFFTIIQF